jgi:hypothetical protein
MGLHVRTPYPNNLILLPLASKGFIIGKYINLIF